MTQTEKFLESKWLPWLIFLIGVLLFGMNLGKRDFWAPDEPDFAEIVKEMRERNDVFVPYLNGKPYSEKPPMLYWSMWLSQEILGEPYELASRVPSVLAGAGGLVLIFLLGRRFFSAKAGLVAAAMLATSVQYLWRSAYLQTDMLFAFFCFLTLYFFWKLWEKEKPEFLNDGLPFYTALILAILTKGPLAAVIVFIVIGGLVAWNRDWAKLKKLYLVRGLLFAFAGTIWWYIVVGTEAGEGFLKGAIIREHIQRFFDTDSHKQPIYYYFLTIWGDAFPWSLFIPLALWLGWKQREKPAVRFLLVWFLGTFLFLTLCDSKQGKYLLPTFPAIALLIVHAFENGDLFPRARQPRVHQIGQSILDLLGVTLFAAAIFALVVSFTHWLPPIVTENLDPDIVPMVIRFMPVFHPFILFAALSLFVFRNRGSYARIGCLAGGIMVSFLVIAHFYPQLNSLKSARPLMERTAKRMEENAELAVFGSFRGTYAYYSGRYVKELKTVEDLDALLQSEKPMYCLVQEERLKNPSTQLKSQFWELDSSRVGSKKLTLISNRPANKK